MISVQLEAFKRKRIEADGSGVEYAYSARLDDCHTLGTNRLQRSKCDSVDLWRGMSQYSDAHMVCILQVSSWEAVSRKVRHTKHLSSLHF